MAMMTIIAIKRDATKNASLSLPPCVHLDDDAEILVLRHEGRILGQWSNPVSGSKKSQASSPLAKQHRA